MHTIHACLLSPPPHTPTHPTPTHQHTHHSTVTITGTDLFGHGSNITDVSFLGIPASIDYSQISNMRLRVRVNSNNNTVDTPASIRMVADTSAIVESNGSVWTYLVEGRVSNVMPAQGQIGTIVEVVGTNLLGGGSNISEIFLDGVQGRVENASSTSVTVVMGAIETQITGFYSGQVYIMADTGAVVTGGVYQHRESGVITSFSPQQGRQGSRIVLTGNNLLGYGNDILGVDIAGSAGMVDARSTTQVTVRAGSGASGTNGPIQLMIDTGAIVSSTQNFTYEQSGRITMVDPSQGAEGIGILIRGEALRPSTTRVTNITIGGSLVARIVTESDTEISVIAGPAPQMNPNNAEITITASDGSFVRGQTFSYQNLTISLPNIDRGQEGTLVDISLPSNLSSFDPSFDLQATIDDQSAQIVSINVTERYISVTAPRARRAGTYTVDVAVENIDRLVARLRDGFTYLPEGVIFSATPEFGQRGTRVVLEGENLLGGGDRIASATLAGVSAVVRSNTSETIELEISDNPDEGTVVFPYLGDIVLRADTNAIIRRLGGFTLLQPGRITMIMPVSGQFGTRVSIVGSDLLQNTTSANISSVSLAGQIASIMGDPSDSQITVQAADAPGGVNGTIEVTLTSGARITSDSDITFQYLERGQITSVTPSNGTVGTQVEIVGTNLLGGGNTVTNVILDGVNATNVTSSPTSITVTAGEGTPGTAGDVEIISETGATVTGIGLWTYEDLGTITSVDPPVGQQGVDVRIAGVSLLGGSAARITNCSLADVPGEVMSSSNELVICRAGFNLTPRSGTVRLVADSGPVITSNASLTFTYYGASFDRIEPTNGTNGTYVNITGINLFGFPGGNISVQNVMFGSVNVTEIITITGNDIRVRVGASNATSDDTVRVVSTSGAFLELENAWSYVEPGEVMSIQPEFGFPGDTITISGENLVPPCVPGVRVILGQTESFTATIINTSAVEFRPGIYQEGTVTGSNLDNPQDALPVQIIASNGATVFTDLVNFRYNATGEINLINPDAGGIGSEVVITGRNLLSDGNVSQVMLAGVPVNQIVNTTDTEITVIARAGPDMGTSGGVLIESDNGRLTGIAGNVWTYFPVIQASDVTPQTGQNGTLVNINLASRIPANYSVEQVVLAGVPSSPVNSSTITEIRRAGPSNETQVGNITIEYGGGDTGLGATVTIVDAWRYEPPVQIDSVSPGQGYFNTLVVITGSNFRPGGVMVRQVYLANILTTIDSQTDTELQVRIAEMIDSSSGPLTGPIVIASQNGAIFTSQITFTYVQVRVNSVDPQTGQEGTRVRIQGVGLLAGGTSITSLTLGGIQANVSSRTNSDILAVAAMSPTETNITDISYTVDTQAVVRIPSRWQYVPPGVITGVSPSEGNRGTVVTVTGSRMFGGGDRTTMVLLNNIPASEILVSDENLVQVVAGASENALSPGTVQVIANTGAFTESQLSTASFTYLEPGSVTFNPPQGQNGTRVTLSGLRFHNGEGVRRVTLAGVEATIEGTPTSTSVTVRAGRPSRLESFEGPVRIESGFGTITESETNFTYLEEGLVLSVTPTRGQNGTMVYIEGERLFGGGGRAQSVYLAGVEAAIVDMSSVSINVTAGEQTNATTGDIIIVSDSGAYVRRINEWTYAQQGVITTINPSQGQYGTTITVSGERLFSGGDNVEQVLIGGVLAFDITSINESTVRARAGEPGNGAAFAGNVTLISNFGGRLESDVEWSYLNQSAITDVSPPNGTSDTTVTVTGTNLLGGGTRIVRVFAAGIEAMNITEAENEMELVFVTGFNPNGIEVLGNISLESDTGALTIIENGWMYENECPSGSFGTVDNCTSCDPECMRCFGPEDTDCSVCNNFRIVLADSAMRCVSQCPNVSTLDQECRDACELNQFARVNSTQTGNTVFCYNCSSLCDATLSCSGPEPTQCGRCANFFDTSSQSCVQTCPVGTFSNESNSCVPCNSQCVATAGCFGPTAADCNQCTNVQISASLIDSPTATPGDVCLERCPVAFYLDVNRFCQPCSSECAGNCTGPTPFDCIDCRSFSVVYPNNTRQCVPTCNPDPNRLTMYSETSGRCQVCSSRCSVQGGCRGPSARDCIGCAFSPDNTTRLPTLEGECVLFCNSSYYNDIATGECQSCDDSCLNNGCTGPSPQNCMVAEQPADTFIAGPGTIAVFVVISFFLLIILVLLVACLIWRVTRRSKYTLTDEERIEFGERYIPRVHPPPASETTFSPVESKKEKFVEKPKPTGATNGGAFVPEDGLELYTEMGPDETDTKKVLYKEVIKQHLVKDQRSEGVTGSQDLYTDMEPSPVSPVELTAPVRPPKPEQDRPAKAPPRAEKKPPPLPPPEKAAPPRPPSPEVYTDMETSVQEIIINPGTDEEYSEMAPTEGMVEDEFYEDAGSVRSPDAGAVRPPLSSPTHPQSKRSSTSDEKAPLLDQYISTEPIADDLYEDTETAVVAAEQYKRISSSNLPPALPSRPAPKKRTSEPLPPTPLQKSLSSNTVSKPPPEDLYMEPEAPVEESLYEAIPGHERLIADPPPPSNRRGGRPPSNALPLPPKPK